VPDQTVDGGALTTAVFFSGTASAFNWVNDTPGIGLPASGTGNIAAFTAVNKGKTPVTATITVTPANSGLAYITNYDDGTVSVINTTTNEVINTIRGGLGSGVDAVSASADGSLVYVANLTSNDISVISTSLNSVIATIPVGSYPSGVIASADGSRVYVSDNGSDDISVIDATTNTVIDKIPVGSNPRGLALTPNGDFLYVTYGEDDFVISVINTKNDMIIANITVGYWDYGISAAPDGTEVYVTNGTSNVVSAINTSTNSIIFGIPLTSSLGFGDYGLTISPDGRHVYVINDYDNNVSVIDAASGSVEATINVGREPEGISVSADNKRIYVTNANDGTVSVIDAATNTVISTVAVGASPASLGNFISKGTGCSGQPVTFTITVNPAGPVITPGAVVVPNTFTPNGDGINDNWDIKNISLYPNCTVQIYNRYGENVYSSVGYGSPWDGTYKGSGLPTGTYYYVINLKDNGKPLSGFVAIVR
jgi:gliding motility-associated-like protein